jgi:uncharacterized protein (DUF362 family)
MNYRGFIAPLAPRAIEAALDHLQLPIARDTRVFLKPNLTWKRFQPGITTSPAFMEGLIRALADRRAKVTIGESDGGNNLFTADEAMAAHGLPEIAQRYGASLLNLTHAPRRRVVVGPDCEVEFSRPLLEDFDFLLSVPVPKVHAMTGVSLAIKNLWGCVPDPLRLRHHWNINPILCRLVEMLPPSAALFDGTHFLNDFGPMDGTPVPRNLIVGADNLLAGSLLCCRLMNVDPNGIAMLRAAMAANLGPSALQQVELNTDIDPFLSETIFKAKKIPLNYLTGAAFHSRYLTRLLYDSALGNVLHQCLYRVRRLQAIRTLLYRDTRFVE